MGRKIKIYIVDDDLSSIKLMEAFLKAKGYDVLTNTSSVNACDDILQQKPDVVITDIIMPVVDGLELCKRLRLIEELKSTKIIVSSSKAYDYDKERALSLGADCYIVKPIVKDDFINKIEEILHSRIVITFWGVRGTLPVPGKKTLRYGGNTSCVSISFPKERFFIFDAGSGIKELSNHLLSTKKSRFKANIFISHPHWDHINGLPFFVPLYMQGNEFEICGASHGDIKMRKIISDQMEGINFPVTIREFGSRTYFRDLTEDSYKISDISVKTKLLTHPGYDLGYRIDYEGKTICYITDNELYPPDSKHYSQTFRDQLIDFVKDADILIHECTYFDKEYPKKINWGHSSVTEVASLSHDANAKNLYLFHHDPDQSDDDIDQKLELTNKILLGKKSNTKAFAAVEQEEIIIHT